ncbi:hypothetical protein UCDDS831_g08108 [Diplodia seriata]|uniref:Uncharacterized protein n=1 Tax=Diplodia seriata TaxID=420778 RepID=A0A0G2DVM8_9PEZI|nr:hypothetical protein UCDDS831_g08108 [Diplodia seriata]
MRQTQVSDNEQLKAVVVTQNKQIALLKSQFQHLRISHEAHASTLAEAHHREIDAMRSYVHYLEESRDCKPMKDQMEQLVARKDAYKDRAADLEVRVHDSHEMLIDLRESEYKLEIERRLMHERYRELKAELVALRTQPEQSRIGDLENGLAEEKLRAELLATQLEAMQLRAPLPNTVAELTKTIDDLKSQLKEKDDQIYELQHVNQALQLDLEEMDTQQARQAAEHDEALAQESRERRAVKDKVKQLDHENTELKEIVEAQGEDLVSVQDEYELPMGIWSS